MDDIVRQFKGVSDGLMRRVGKSPSFNSEPSSLAPSRNVSWNPDEINKLAGRRTISESLHSYSDNEEGDKDAHHGQQDHESSALLNGGHLDNELKDDPTGVPPEVSCVNFSFAPILIYLVPYHYSPYFFSIFDWFWMFLAVDSTTFKCSSSEFS